MYRITKKFDRAKQNIIKLFLLDYPNDEDKANSKQKLQKDTLPSSAKIGGLD